MITAKGRRKTFALHFDDGWYTAESKYFGSYQVKRDERAPLITPLSITGNATYTTRTILKWKIVERETSLADYDIFIDGKWYLLEYEYKGNYVTFKRPEGFTGKKEVIVRAVDRHGNISEWKRTIDFR